jgi:rod shape-determining protein MreD
VSTLLKLLALALGLLLAQALAPDTLPEWVRPDFVLVFALAMGLRSAPLQGLALAFGLGFVVDVLSGSPPGLFALLRGTACALTRLFDRALYLRAPLPWAAYVCGYALFDGLLMALVFHLFAPEGALSLTTLLTRAPGQALATALLAAPLLSVFDRLDAQSEREGSLQTFGLGGSRSRP